MDHKTLFTRACRVIPGGVNSPVRAFNAVGGTPVFVSSGKGSRLTLADGRRFEAEALTNKGDTEDPYSPEEVRAKFADLAGPVWGASHAAAIADCVASIDRAADLSTLTRLLSAPAAAGGSV